MLENHLTVKKHGISRLISNADENACFLNGDCLNKRTEKQQRDINIVLLIDVTSDIGINGAKKCHSFIQIYKYFLLHDIEHLD